MKEKLKNKYIIIGILMLIFNILLLLDIYNFNINLRFIISLFFEIIIVLFLYKFLYKRKTLLENKFIISFFVIGLFYLFLFPIGSLPDEINHFMRGYEISKGDLISSKCKTKTNKPFGCTDITPEIQKAIIKNDVTYSGIKKSLNYKYNSTSKKNKVGFNNISFYSFICYTPQAIGILLGRLLHLPILIWAYLARLFNFIFFVFLLCFSVKKIPYKKEYVMFISLLPITIQEAISMAADCMAIGSSLALICYVLSLIESKDKINKNNIIILFLLSFLLSMSKLVYLPCVLILILIPSSKFKSVKSKYLILGCLTFVIGILNLLWLNVASDFLSSIEGAADSALQTKFIMHNPIRFLIIILNSINVYFDWYFESMIGVSLGLFSINPSKIYIKLDILIFIFMLLFSNEKKIKNNIKIVSLLIFIIVVCLIFTSLYLDWTVVGNNLVEGVQGRYFTPILLYLILCLSTTNFTIKNNNIINKQNMLLFMVFENIYIITLIFSSY